MSTSPRLELAARRGLTRVGALALPLAALVGCAAQRNDSLADFERLPAVQLSGPSAEADFVATAALDPLAASTARSAVQEEAGALHGLYFFAGGGWSSLDESLSNDSNFDGSVDDSDTAIDAGFGYRLHEFVALEASWCDAGEFSYDGTDTGSSNLVNGTLQVAGIELSALGRYRFAERFEAQARLGAFFWESDAEDVVDDGKGVTKTDNDDSGIDLLYGLGLQADLTEHIGVRAEWRRLADAGGDDIDAFLLHILYIL